MRLFALMIHFWTLLRGGVMRWRLETFGLYMPSFPHERPWWQVNPRAMLTLLAQLPAYQGWLGELTILRRRGPHAAWQRRLSHGPRAWDRYIATQNATDDPDDDTLA